MLRGSSAHAVQAKVDVASSTRPSARILATKGRLWLFENHFVHSGEATSSFRFSVREDSLATAASGHKSHRTPRPLIQRTEKARANKGNGLINNTRPVL
jgi:hypothetical protein